MGRYAYESQDGDRPAAPFIQIQLINPYDSSLAIYTRGLLDTGSDFTHISPKLLSKIQLKPFGRPRSFFGATSDEEAESFACFTSILIGNQLHPCIKVWTWEIEDFVLVGRDLMNRHLIEFDGPNLVVSIA